MGLCRADGLTGDGEADDPGLNEIRYEQDESSVHDLITTTRESDSMICVSQSTDPLPTDIATLQALLLEARAERDAVVAERDHLQSQNVRLPGCEPDGVLRFGR
jgi:hypothetical protein